MPSLRGVGVTTATSKIQIDRYSLKSPEGVSIAFIDTLNKFAGWKTIMNGPSAWIQYNKVDFGRNKLRSLKVRALSTTGGTLLIKLDKTDGPLIGQVTIPKGNEWETVTVPLLLFSPGLHELFATIQDNANIQVDWVSFE
jgi:hypothetical protein